MAELLLDNMELKRRRDMREIASSACGQQPNRREVPDLLSWVQCFGMYAAVLFSSQPDKTQQLYAYQTMIVREARRCGGKGWLAYDQIFRQQAAVRATDWSKLNNSLYVTTFLQQQNGETAWRRTICCMSAPWHPYGQAVCPHSHAHISLPTMTKGGVRDRVPKYFIHGAMVGVQLGLTVSIVTCVLSVGPVLTKR